MVNGISVVQRNGLELGKINLPSLILDDGELTTRRFVEFFTAQIRNKGTRATYANAVFDFCDWCTARNITLKQVEPIVVAGYKKEDISETEREFIRNGIPAEPPATMSQTTASVMPGMSGRIPLTARVRPEIASAIKKASLRRQLDGVVPNSMQAIMEEALEAWLKANGLS